MLRSTGLRSAVFLQDHSRAPVEPLSGHAIGLASPNSRTNSCRIGLARKLLS